MTKETAGSLHAAIHDFRVIEELAKARLDTLHKDMESCDESEVLRKQGEAKEIRFWMKIGTVVNNALTAP